MGHIVTNLGLKRSGSQTFQSTSYNVARFVRTMSVDDSGTALNSGSTTLGSPTTEFDKAFDATPTESSQTIVLVMTMTTAEGNMTIQRLIEHDDTVTNVTGTSTTIFGGVYAQTLAKNSDFSLAVTKNYTFSDVP